MREVSTITWVGIAARAARAVPCGSWSGCGRTERAGEEPAHQAFELDMDLAEWLQYIAERPDVQAGGELPLMLQDPDSQVANVLAYASCGTLLCHSNVVRHHRAPTHAFRRAATP